MDPLLISEVLSLCSILLYGICSVNSSHFGLPDCQLQLFNSKNAPCVVSNYLTWPRTKGQSRANQTIFVTLSLCSSSRVNRKATFLNIFYSYFVKHVTECGQYNVRSGVSTYFQTWLLKISCFSVLLLYNSDKW